MTTIDYAVGAAIASGWTLQRQDERWAVLHGPSTTTPGRKAGTGFHVVNLLLTLVTLGIWLAPYLAIWFGYHLYLTSTGEDQPKTTTQQLVIALDQDDNVTYEVRINGVTQ
jgi:hypothetical protein